MNLTFHFVTPFLGSIINVGVLWTSVFTRPLILYKIRHIQTAFQLNHHEEPKGV